MPGKLSLRRVSSALSTTLPVLLIAQTFDAPRPGVWVIGPRANRRDLSADAFTPGTLLMAGKTNMAMMSVGCRGLDTGTVLELRASVPIFPGSTTVSKRVNLTIGDRTRTGPMEFVSSSPQIVFVTALEGTEAEKLSRATPQSFGRISLAFGTAVGRGLITAELPSHNPAIDAVLNACRLTTPPITAVPSGPPIQQSPVTAAPLQSTSAAGNVIEAAPQTASSPKGSVSNKIPTLDRISEAAERYVNSVPDFVCKETLHSEQTGFTNRPIHWVMDTKADFRVVRSATGNELKEERLISSQDGKSVTPPRADITLPYKLVGAFGPPLGAYLKREHRSCLQFKLDKDRVDFTAIAEVAGKGICSDIAPQARGFLLFDPVTAAITRFERNVPATVAQHIDFAAFGSVDYRPVELNGIIYQLPSHITGKKQIGRLTQIFDASYNGCQKFTADTTITFQ